MARKTYTREFKLQAVRMITDQGLSLAEVARRLGVTEGALRAWRAAAQEHSVSVALSHTLALRVRPEFRFPALALLPGHIPAHDAR